MAGIGDQQCRSVANIANIVGRSGPANDSCPDLAGIVECGLANVGRTDLANIGLANIVNIGLANVGRPELANIGLANIVTIVLANVGG